MTSSSNNDYSKLQITILNFGGEDHEITIDVDTIDFAYNYINIIYIHASRIIMKHIDSFKLVNGGVIVNGENDIKLSEIIKHCATNTKLVLSCVITQELVMVLCNVVFKFNMEISIEDDNYNKVRNKIVYKLIEVGAKFSITDTIEHAVKTLIKKATTKNKESFTNELVKRDLKDLFIRNNFMNQNNFYFVDNIMRHIELTSVPRFDNSVINEDINMNSKLYECNIQSGHIIVTIKSTYK